MPTCVKASDDMWLSDLGPQDGTAMLSGRLGPSVDAALPPVHHQKPSECQYSCAAHLCSLFLANLIALAATAFVLPTVPVDLEFLPVSVLYVLSTVDLCFIPSTGHTT